MKTTKLTIKEDKPTSISSTAHNSNLDTMGFNLTFLMKHNKKLALRVIKLYEEAFKVR